MIISPVSPTPPSTDAPYVLLQETFPGTSTRWWRFRDPLRVIEVTEPGDVGPALEEVEAAAEDGLHAVGFITYESAPAFDRALQAVERGELPLLWWGLFQAPVEAGPPAPAEAPELDWRPLLARDCYEDAIHQIHDAIARGDTYQVNYTFQLEAAFDGDPQALFSALWNAQHPLHGAYLDTGRFAVCSASPELFFTLDGERIVARPMKGTARRGRYLAEDELRRGELLRSAKDRAENVMIVDMVRNDLGHIARPGSVRVDALCEAETYPTVHQLTSTVHATSSAPVSEILRALFPSASITGAPKISTTRLIRQLETSPRGVYTGTIGHLGPGRRAHFTVAIRTATVDRTLRRVTYGTGGGIVWDSDAASEYEECRTKAFVLRRSALPFELLETLVWRPRSGYFLLERHLERMAGSARYFGLPCDRAKLRGQLDDAARGFAPERQRVRVLLDGDGAIRVDSSAYPCAGRETWTIGLDDRPIDASDVFYFHKTTRRHIYTSALERHPELDEVVLWNERGELTETTRANLVLRLGAELLTPPVDCGLLAGTYRAELLARGRLREAVLPVEKLDEADEVLLINSVRGFVRSRRPGGTAS